MVLDHLIYKCLLPLPPRLFGPGAEPGPERFAFA